MLRLWILTLGLVVIFGASGCERLYQPCSITTHCTEFGGDDMRCVVSPYHGESMGFCTLECDGFGPGLRSGDCVQDDTCGPDDAEGCCYINHVEGRAEFAHGRGFCVPFPPPVGEPRQTVEPVE